MLGRCSGGSTGVGVTTDPDGSLPHETYVELLTPWLSSRVR
ncbi:hypothetical protein [Streptomyces sp. NPDC002671]